MRLDDDTPKRHRGVCNQGARSLASATADWAAGRYNSCVNRCYFSCFQAATAALIRDGSLSPRSEASHRLVQSSFSELVRRKVVSSSLNSTLQRLRELRTVGDYRPAPVSRRSANEALRLAMDFVTGAIR